MLWNCDKKHYCRRNCEIWIVNLHCEKDHCENKGFGKQKQKWSLSTMQNHNEHFITVYRKMKLQIQLLKIHCWIDDICVIAEDDPVRTLRLASDHIGYIQLTSDNRPYSNAWLWCVHCTICICILHNCICIINAYYLASQTCSGLNI